MNIIKVPEVWSLERSLIWMAENVQRFASLTGRRCVKFQLSENPP